MKDVCSDQGNDCEWVYADTSSSMCSQNEVIGSCSCESDATVTHYRSSFSGAPKADCESPDFTRCVYTAR